MEATLVAESTMKKEDFKDMPINPFAAGPLLKEYDLLQRVSAFSEAPDGVEDEKGKTIYLDPRDIDKMLRFCVLMADPRGNPLATEQDFTFRAAAAWCYHWRAVLALPHRHPSALKDNQPRQP